MITRLRFTFVAIACLLAAHLTQGKPTDTDTPLSSARAAIDMGGKIYEAALDDPRRALASLREARSLLRADEDLYWSYLNEARILGLLEQPEEMGRALGAARVTLARVAAQTPLHVLPLRAQEIQLLALTSDLEELREPATKLATQAESAGSQRLACEVALLRASLGTETAMVDQAWQLAERALSCTRKLSAPGLEAMAQLQMGLLARIAEGTMSDRQTAYRYLRLAADVANEIKSRYLLSIIEWESGKALGRSSIQSSEKHFLRARALSKDIHDEVGIAVTSVDLGDIALERRQYGKATQLAREARAIYKRYGLVQRLPSTYRVSIPALINTDWQEAQRELSECRSLDNTGISGRERAHLWKAIATALASKERYAEAYQGLVRGYELEAAARRDESERLLLRLQTAHEASEREAKNAQLELRNQAARLQLEAASVKQQRLAIALILAILVLALLGAVFVRLLMQRRKLAALAMRDELTGAPNRRSILAIAEATLVHGRAVRVPMLIGMIDLDFFKRVNDVHGHGIGDLVLKAFASSAREALRSQDRIGRFGGEEWLLVAPGATEGDAASIFERIQSKFSSTEIAGLPFPHHLTFSFGAAFDRENRAEISSLIEEADKCLYEAKASGRNTYRCREVRS